MMKHLDHSERAIIAAILDAASARGLLVSVFDGEEWPVVGGDARAAASSIGDTDETILRFRGPATGSSDVRAAPSVGWVSLIHGNGLDVIHDHADTPTMRALLAPAFALSESLSV